jgi:hypothetical protein
MAPANPLLYSLERLLPMLDLLQRRELAAPLAEPAEAAAGWGALAHAVTVLEAVLGWLASVMLITTLAGWTDRDRRS